MTWTTEQLTSIIDAMNADDREQFAGRSICEVAMTLMECDHDNSHTIRAAAIIPIISEYLTDDADDDLNYDSDVALGNLMKLMDLAFLRGVQFGKKIRAGGLSR